MNLDLRQRLLEMEEEDRRVREALSAAGELFQGYAAEMAKVHQLNAEKLELMIEQYGWPGKSLVGEDGANAAWLILQHAIGNPELQRRCLPILQKAVAQGETEPAHAAYLEDRICFFERRPQRYGTHFDWDKEGNLSPWLLENAERVDEYRGSVGLPPLAQQIAEVCEETKDEPKPTDFKKRQEELLTWAKSVGWL